VEWIPNHPTLDRVSRFGQEIRQSVPITAWINLLVGVADAVLLLILGVDFAILWGILAWLLGYIPSIGFWLALVPSFLGICRKWYDHGFDCPGWLRSN
jgi:AI-2 transport protein TqsA